MPPSHSVMDRQSKIVAGTMDRFSKPVAPVVVSPDTDSKMAGAKFNYGGQKRYGRAANSEHTIHPIPTRPMASLRSISLAEALRPM